jgi:large subunit ribosomal protein L9
MKVLLKEDVDNLGYTGEVLQVADGYGRNYLIPRGLAVKASPSALKQAHSWRERAAVRLTELRREHEALSLKINDTNLNFYARAGETGKLYGSITTADITEQLNEVLGTDVDRRLVTGGPLRQLGEHRVTVRLSRDYQPQIVVQIHPHTEVESEEDEPEVEVETTSELETSEEIEEISEEDSSEEEISEEESSEEASSEVEEAVEELDEPAEETEIPEADDEEAEEED